MLGLLDGVAWCGLGGMTVSGGLLMYYAIERECHPNCEPGPAEIRRDAMIKKVVFWMVTALVVYGLAFLGRVGLS